MLIHHVILANGIENFWHENSISKNMHFNQKEFEIITTASIEYNKNLLSVAEVITNLNGQGYKIKYNIVGTVQDKSIFNKLIRNQHINYLGVLNRD
jgi:glycosyltransferase involved in cell wall biosynthesis